MATFVLSSVGATMGSAYGAGAAIAGMALGSALGNVFDNNIFARNNKISQSKGKINSIPIQNSSYGIVINKIYGESRVAGNLIWSNSIKEHINKSYRHVKSGKAFARKKTTITTTKYSYSASFAIAICEGVIDYVEKIWADSKILINSNYNFRIYNGSEEQMPDPYIEGIMGRGKTPAYRGIAYIVFENFPLGDFGNRIPNFSFHVKKQAQASGITNLESKIRSVCIIPGSGEFVYENNPQYLANVKRFNNRLIQSGKNRIINHNNYSEYRDAELSLNQLLRTCPNLEWVAPVVGWFGDSLDIANCNILPGVENKKRNTYPLEWMVGDYNRQTAKLITQRNNAPIYGGTLNDESVINYLKLLKSKNLKIMFYPMLFIDLHDKPWRGNLTGSSKDIERFFNGPNGFNRFILHYAKLVKDYVDAFIIGSEMVSLTKIKDSENQFQAVKEFVKLADKVREVVGPNVKITYAADWSEYHHTDGGWYHLDELWASDNIDFIGVDAYFPLTNIAENANQDEISKGWFSGEGFDYQYSDSQKKNARRISKAYAWKDVQYWWENNHYNPDGKKTAWKPKSKKIWFTEYGFPSVDCCTNEPNVFFDNESREGGLPFKSEGNADFLAQRRAIDASQNAFRKMEFLENDFLWTWDARPYPFWPRYNNIWNDAYKWQKGHWVNGKFGLVELSTLIAELCVEAGLDLSDIEFEAMDEIIDGVVVSNDSSALDILQNLKKAFLFDIVENGSKIKFIGSYKHASKKLVKYNDLIIDNQPDLTISKDLADIDISQISLCYRDKENDFQIAVARSSILDIEKQNIENIDLDLVLTKASAQNIANNIMAKYMSNLNSYNFRLPMKYLYLQAGDQISFEYKSERFIDLKIENIFINNDFTISVGARSYMNSAKANDSYMTLSLDQVRRGFFERPDYDHKIIELHNVGRGFSGLYMALWSKNKAFNPAAIYISDDSNEYIYLDYINSESSIGYLISHLPDTQIGVRDASLELIITSLNKKLFSISEEELFKGGNSACINGEIIQFQYVQSLGDNLYKISNIIRGQNATGHFVKSHDSGELIIFLDKFLKPIEQEMSPQQKYYYKIAEEGIELDSLPSYDYMLKALENKALPPVNVNYDIIDGVIYLSWVGQCSSNSFWNEEVVAKQESKKYFIEIYDKNNNSIHADILYQDKLTLNKKPDMERIHIYSLNQMGEKGVPYRLII